MLLRLISARLKVLFLFAMLTTAPTAQAQTAPFGDVAIRDAVSRHARSNATVQNRRVPRRTLCNLKRRVLTGAAIGAVTGMVLVHRVAAGHDGSAGLKDMLGVGAAGAGLGALIVLDKCR